jgi:hypothetical protein
MELSKNEKEFYLILMGWTTEKSTVHYYYAGDIWYIPPNGSPILKKYEMTRILEHAFEWQKCVDEGRYVCLSGGN